MTEKEKIILAQMQVENLLILLKGNAYENYMCGKLHGVCLLYTSDAADE